MANTKNETKKQDKLIAEKSLIYFCGIKLRNLII